MVIAFFPALVRKAIYPAPRYPVPREPGPGIRVLDLDGICTWIAAAPNADAATPVVLYMHGNAENLGSFRDSGLMSDFIGLGAHFAVFDYPGYGQSRGSASESQVTAAAVTVFDWLEREYPSNPKYLVGWSLGAAVAIHLASQRQESLRGLVLLSAWSSLREIAMYHYPDWLVRLFLSEDYDSVALADQITLPVLMLHGDGDEIIPANQGRQLADALVNGRFALVEGFDHNDLMYAAEVWQALRAFVRP